MDDFSEIFCCDLDFGGDALGVVEEELIDFFFGGEGSRFALTLTSRSVARALFIKNKLQLTNVFESPKRTFQPPTQPSSSALLQSQETLHKTPRHFSISVPIVQVHLALLLVYA